MLLQCRFFLPLSVLLTTFFVGCNPSSQGQDSTAKPGAPAPAKIKYVTFKEGEKYGFKLQGKVIVPARFDNTYGFFRDCPFASVKVGKLWGYIDTSGKYLVEPKYDLALPYEKSLAKVQNND